MKNILLTICLLILGTSYGYSQTKADNIKELLQLMRSEEMINKAKALYLADSWPEIHTYHYPSQSFVACMQGRDYTTTTIVECIDISHQ